MPGTLRSKAVEPILLHLLGRARFAGGDARIRFRGGGKASVNDRTSSVVYNLSKSVHIKYFVKFIEWLC
ncbi:40S ribosomal protein S16 [Ananas comosus]|uniref:40S ribosomal protein S16 n=1 Tax=Ananas comosus TaxID=4615 RepID=A0A199VMY4_ANACO|nr:40S ribosomal protein S16 [Ananas comosus]